MADGTFELHERYDVDEINRINQSLFKARYDSGEGVLSGLKKQFREYYGYDIKPHQGPYLAVVLKVLSGPQLKKREDANTDPITSTIINIYESIVEELDDLFGTSERVKIIARIPSFDADIKFPEGSQDEFRISCHSEFVAQNSDSSFEEIKPGSLVYVVYNNPDSTTGFSGMPSGVIVGVNNRAGFKYIAPRELSEFKHLPKCKSVPKLAGPGGGMYVGETIANPNKPSGPSISKIKSQIKSGFYGNGTGQTKAHFDAAMKNSLQSVKHRIPGPAPGSENAFVWVGNLKNNGYLDLLDRPIGSGRETIIYAPMTLDLNSPIEIKYYFHDKAGFGHSWASGPHTTIQNSVDFAGEEGNDFREKIGPGIKDLIKQGRNFVLVIPELAHSRGYGTGLEDDKRIKDISSGKKASGYKQALGKGTLRTSVNSKMRAVVKEYLSKIPIEQNQNLLHITSLLERPYCNFDGSFSGGRFDLFHQEVIDVLSEHMGKIDDKVGFVSILADGLGALSLASIVKAIPNSSVHFEAEKAFKNVKIDRIDYITSEKLDTSVNNLYFPSTPSYSIYSDYLTSLSGMGRTVEFNYVTEKSLSPTNEFFSRLGINDKFQKANKNSSSPGELKFSHPVGGSVFVTLHVCPKDTTGNKATKFKVGYAFSAENGTLLPSAPRKSDTSSITPSYNEVPDHAKAIASSPAQSDLARYEKELADLEGPIAYFEGVLINTLDALKSDPPKEPPGFLPSSYQEYLQNKKKFMKAEMLLELEAGILKISNNYKQLLQAHEDLDAKLDKIKNKQTIPEHYKNAQERWRKLTAGFSVDNFTLDAFGEGDPPNPGTGLIAKVAQLVVEPEVLSIITEKIMNAAKTLKPRDRDQDPECFEDVPISLDNFGSTTVKIPTANITPAFLTCKDIKIAPASSYEELIRMIPYYPSKSDFFTPGDQSRVSTKETDIQFNVLGYEASSFKYKARGINGAVTYHNSPPIWSCIANKLQQDWESACNVSGYIPFRITSGIKGAFKQKGPTAYKHGISFHSFGLALDLDPYITGHSEDGEPLYSVYTGAWTPGFMQRHGEELEELGVIKKKSFIGITSSRWDNFYENAYDGVNVLRTAENWDDAHDAYKNKKFKKKYDKIMFSAKGSPIVPYGANPTLWLIQFCERTGMKWGNSTFLKKRHRGGNSWSTEEQNRIAAIYGIPDIVARIYSISWSGTRFDDHMHFQYYDGNKDSSGIITWKEIEKTRKKLGK